MGKPELLLTVPDKKGLFTVVPTVSPIMKHVHMEFLRMDNDDSTTIGNTERELGVVLLGGRCRLRYDGHTEAIDGRKDAFSGLPHAIYIPAGQSVTIEARGSVEAVIFGTPASSKGAIGVVRPENIHVLTIGEGNWYINGYFIIGSDFPAQRLIVGETQIPAGNWSSVPPHSHEKDVPNVESALEEIYYFQFKPPRGFGMQGIYTDDRSLDEAYMIRHNSVILIPRGYHPNVAGPGYEMRMFWGMAGTTRNWIPYEDPDHSHLGKKAQSPSGVPW